MTLIEKVNELKKIKIFQNLTESDFTEVANNSGLVTYKAGEIIFKENMFADAFYIILEGEVVILKQGDDGQLETLAVKKMHDFFGEMSMIDELPRSATIKAKDSIVLLKIEKDNFLSLLQRLPNLSFSVAKSVCYTVRASNETYIRDLEDRNNELEAAYKELQKTQNELINAERLSVIGKFASLIIHDIKNPLTNIRAYAELIGLSLNNSEKINRSSNIIIKEVDRLVDMTSELLEFARGDIKLNRSPVNFYSYLATLIDTVRADIKNRNIDIDLKTPFDDIIVKIDSEKMKRVFFNLIGNACDAIETNGTIEISIENRDSNLLWSIKDTGCGMTPDIIERLFEPFFTKKKKGTGLGMAIVLGIINSHNGNIEVFSTPGEGSRFDIYLPLEPLAESNIT